ncbi:MAG: type I-E CRISPR-associated protein Cas5/CasD [Kytococcus sp.]|nr:type I-E CRISPR-associated protein Cas5/CasD [Kytococcus sp.]
MATLLMCLAGPLQSWGDSSRFTRRHTRAEPTKSGVLGLLAAARGSRRSDPIEDLLQLTFGVRVDQPGRLVRDFQTAIRWSSPKKEAMPLSYRYYLSDAVFVAGVCGDGELLAGLDEALRNPRFPPFLGRRSCPPSRPVAMGVVEDELESALRDVPWQASTHHRRDTSRSVRLDLLVDAAPGEPGELVRDVPHSWSTLRREYGWRPVRAAAPVIVDNPEGRSEPDYFAVVAAE